MSNESDNNKWDCECCDVCANLEVCHTNFGTLGLGHCDSSDRANGRSTITQTCDTINCTQCRMLRDDNNQPVRTPGFVRITPEMYALLCL
jgi:hypothetical protein